MNHIQHYYDCLLPLSLFLMPIFMHSIQIYLLSRWWSSPQHRFFAASNKVFHGTEHDRKLAILSEAQVASKPKEWSGYFHLTALATVLGRSVFSSYPNCQTCI
ncbi:hypothetical protein P5673_027473 [Acropora cervicornis]|uniref:Uncharacterized protein n=1 Tax=Acropora cervicornis TaxID=6130 RepID=A0AAD9PZR8_ACRCE|nr:hypothetical protein P5673_027473 [Acropora cervicornis]